ncbi:MAG: diguanylate cyclase [Candidatus Hydrogenedentes bacterium]|nr:diguanylate cyclase [Candidatus Hydrogenedentota bacterium]
MPAPRKSIALIADPRPAERAALERILSEAGYEVRTAETGQEALDIFYAEPPRCLVLKHGMPVREGLSLLKEIKSDNVYGHLPAVEVVSRAELEAGIDWDGVPADDYVVEPLDATELLSRIRICWARAQRDVNANPLTGLPGNLTITREAEQRLAANQAFAFAYLDLDAFKAYNDKYGFSRGDEVLRMTARVVVNAIRALGNDNTYVGHIGGDDFVFITPCELAAQACESITRSFDLVVTNFYDEDDRARGCIESVDRKGNPTTFPLMACSIGVVDTRASAISHIAELFSRVTEVKSVAKGLPGSNFALDRRK